MIKLKSPEHSVFYGETAIAEPDEGGSLSSSEMYGRAVDARLGIQTIRDAVNVRPESTYPIHMEVKILTRYGWVFVAPIIINPIKIIGPKITGRIINTHRNTCNIRLMLSNNFV